MRTRISPLSGTVVGFIAGLPFGLAVADYILPRRRDGFEALQDTIAVTLATILACAVGGWALGAWSVKPNGPTEPPG